MGLFASCGHDTSHVSLPWTRVDADRNGPRVHDIRRGVGQVPSVGLALVESSQARGDNVVEAGESLAHLGCLKSARSVDT